VYNIIFLHQAIECISLLVRILFIRMTRLSRVKKEKIKVGLLIILYVRHRMRQNNNRKTRDIRRSWLSQRATFSHMNLVSELRENNPEDFRNYLRMNSEMYDKPLSLVAPLITKQSTKMKIPISATERLTATLRYLATGRNLSDLQFSTLISRQSLGQIISETCRALSYIPST